MFDKIKQLTKDTAIYGVSTIVGRFLTFLLVPFYTNIFPPDEYGIVANLYIFIAILNIIYIFGMDAAYLKFASNKSIASEKDNFSVFGSNVCLAVSFPFYNIDQGEHHIAF